MPPAWANSGRPPPLPPSLTVASLTHAPALPSTAGVPLETTTCALPSFAVARMATARACAVAFWARSFHRSRASGRRTSGLSGPPAVLIGRLRPDVKLPARPTDPAGGRFRLNCGVIREQFLRKPRQFAGCDENSLPSCFSVSWRLLEKPKCAQAAHEFHPRPALVPFVSQGRNEAYFARSAVRGCRRTGNGRSLRRR